MNTTQSVAIIRGRGQLTIPDAIRKLFKWTAPSSVVIISGANDEIRIRPYAAKKHVDWDTLVANIKKARSFKSADIDIAEFISKDRENHI